MQGDRGEGQPGPRGPPGPPGPPGPGLRSVSQSWPHAVFYTAGISTGLPVFVNHLLNKTDLCFRLLWTWKVPGSQIWNLFG